MLWKNFTMKTLWINSNLLMQNVWRHSSFTILNDSFEEIFLIYKYYWHLSFKDFFSFFFLTGKQIECIGAKLLDFTACSSHLHNIFQIFIIYKIESLSLLLNCENFTIFFFFFFKKNKKRKKDHRMIKN